MKTTDFKKDTFVSSFYINGHFKTLIVEMPASAKWQMPADSRLKKCDQQARILAEDSRGSKSMR